jgi:RNA polymerase sigma-70 factor, ECF subfamily
LAFDLLTGHPAQGSSAAGEARRLSPSQLRRLVQEHYDFIWRLLARLNVAPAEVDDAAQQVFIVLVSREGLTIKVGSERAFLYGVALRVAKEFRRKTLSQRNHISPDPEVLVDRSLDVEAVAERSQAREKLDRILEQMPDSLKEAFILFELEDMTVPQIAELLAIPTGTVASRLRRARAQFQKAVTELRDQAAAAENGLAVGAGAGRRSSAVESPAGASLTVPAAGASAGRASAGRASAGRAGQAVPRVPRGGES